jgi:hypothetical protein
MNAMRLGIEDSLDIFICTTAKVTLKEKRGVVMEYCNFITKQGAEADENPKWIIPNNADGLPM